MAPRTVLALLFVACACATPGPLSPGELSALNRAEARWQARPFANYQYEIVQDCFCATEVLRWTRVSVRNGRVTDAQVVESGEAIPVTSLPLWSPIDSLFSQLRRAGSDPNLRNIYADVVVQFDAALGFPTRIEWQSKPNIADAGAVYTLRNVRPLD